MILQAHQRLRATEDDPAVENKKRQIDQLQKGLPSKFNKVNVSQDHKDQVHKRINDLKNQVIDDKAQQRVKKQNQPKEK